MLELFINNRKVDLGQDLNIQFTYKSLDVEDPTVINNDFSNTLKLKGTKTNNEIFGNIYRLDSISANFDVTKRVNFTLYDNGNIIESGYMQLNSIDRTFDDITYNITLYGGLGDFFYSLMYNEDGTERTMKDMYYGWRDSLQNENVSILSQHNIGTIQQQWGALTSNPSQNIRVQYNMDLYLSTDASAFTIHEGNIHHIILNAGENLHTNYVPISLFQYSSNVLEISLRDESGVTDDMCCIITSTPYMSVNSLKDIQYVIMVKDIIAETKGKGAYRLTLNSQMKYLWVTGKPNMTIVNNAYFYIADVKLITPSIGETNKLIDMMSSLNEGTLQWFNYEGQNQIVTASHSVYNYRRQVMSLTGITGSFSGPEKLGVIFIDAGDNVVGSYVYDISEGEENLYTTINKVVVPDNASIMYYATLSNYHNTIPIATDNYFGLTKYLKNDIMAIPTYSGLYDDFDNDKCVINVNKLPTSLQDIFKKESGDYKLYNNAFAKVDLPRDLVEWEMRSLCSQYQRTGVKLSTILGACANSDQNGGYNVVFDQSIYKSPYYKDAWVVLDRPDFKGLLDEYSLSNALYMSDTTNHIEQNASLSTSSLEYFSADDTKIQGIMTFSVGFEHVEIPDIKWMRILSDVYKEESTKYDIMYNNWCGYLVRLVPKIGDKVLGLYNAQFVTFNSVLFPGVANFMGFHNRTVALMDAIKQKMNELYPDEHIYDVNNLYFLYNHQELGDVQYLNHDSKEMTYACPMEFNFKNIQAQNVDFYLVVDLIRTHIDAYYDEVDDEIKYKYDVEVIESKDMWYFPHQNVTTKDDYSVINDNAHTTFRYEFNLYSTLTSTSLSDGFINKAVLFKDAPSPFKYLTDFTKMLKLKYIFNNETKTVFITDRYYKNEVEELVVDYGKTINITPTTLTKKYINLSLETPETYAVNLYSVNDEHQYGSQIIDTDYSFNNETMLLIEDNIYKNVIPYTLTSHYFTPTSQVLPGFATVPTMKYYLYKSNGDEKSIDISPLENYAYSPTDLYYDYDPKLCMFDADSKSVDDCMNSLVFFAGVSSINYRLWDPFQDILDINSGNLCHYWDDLYNTFVPLFLKTNKDGYSWNISTPKYQFNKSELNTITTTIYDYWNGYISDLYNTETKQIKVWVHLTSTPKDAMRKFYYVDNQYWIITEILNYSANNYFNQVVLTKVNDKNNYL